MTGLNIKSEMYDDVYANNLKENLISLIVEAAAPRQQFEDDMDDLRMRIELELLDVTTLAVLNEMIAPYKVTHYDWGDVIHSAGGGYVNEQGDTLFNLVY